MNKLREKFNDICEIKNHNHFDILTNKLEQITDDFSIKFYKWMMDNSKIYETDDRAKKLQQYFKENVYEKI